jgi:hypothetical protein
MADVHYLREATMRSVTCLVMCLMSILANASQTDARHKVGVRITFLSAVSYLT